MLANAGWSVVDGAGKPHFRTALGETGEGVSLNFVCQDAVAFYYEVRSRGIQASEPQVSNGMWDTGLTDPDGFRLFFGSLTGTPEGTRLSEVE